MITEEMFIAQRIMAYAIWVNNDSYHQNETLYWMSKLSEFNELIKGDPTQAQYLAEHIILTYDNYYRAIQNKTVIELANEWYQKGES